MRMLGRSSRLVVVFCCLAGCGDDGDSTPTEAATAARACSTVCNKLDSCNVLQGLSVSQCTQSCTSESAAGSSGGDTCQVTNAQAQACIDAIDATSCTQLTSGNLPAACNLCEDDGKAGSGGAGAGGAGGKGGTGGGGAAGSGTGGCSQLNACCSAISGAEQKSACTMVTGMNNDALCSAALTSFRSAGFCP